MISDGWSNLICFFSKFKNEKQEPNPKLVIITVNLQNLVQELSLQQYCEDEDSRHTMT